MPHRRATFVLALCLVAGLGVGATGAVSASTEPPASAAGTTYPVTVETPYGDVTVDDQPTRIVALSLDYVEALISLGVEPIAVPAGYEPGPWITDVIPADSEIFTTALAPNASILEYIASLEPDLIVGDTYLISSDQFDALSEIAPTLTHEDSAGESTTGSWEHLTRTLGTVVGKPSEAERVIAETVALVDEMATRYSGLDGATVAFAAPAALDSIAAALDDQHSGLRLLGALGLEIAADGEAGETYEGGRVMLSLENLAQLDAADLLIMGTFSVELQEALRANPLYHALAAVREGRVLELDTPATAAMNQPSALNIPHLLALLEPFLEQLAS